MAMQLPIDLRKDSKLGVLRLAVHIDRDQAPGRFLDFRKNPPDSSGLSCSREATDGHVERSAAMETRLQGKGDVLQLGLTVIKFLGDVIDLE